jgi:hypothetical protein
MDYRLREFLISSIRSGVVYTKNPTLCIYPPTIEQVIESYEVYQNAFLEAQNEDIMTVEETESWMKAIGIWQKTDEEELEQLPKDLEDAKFKLYENRKDTYFLKYGKSTIRSIERILAEKLHKKNAYYSNTCESYAEMHRLTWILTQTTYKKEKLYHIEKIIESIVEQYQNSVISDNTIRYLARNEPWRSLWITNTKGQFKLFFNADNVDVTLNQKNLVLWSQTYDNIQESIDPPSNDVIEDDDLLDGWFIAQKKKRAKEKNQKELEAISKNEKLNSSKELFVTNRKNISPKEIDELNTDQAKWIKKQRIEAIRKNGVVSYENLPDIQMEGRQQINEQFKNHTKRNK